MKQALIAKSIGMPDGEAGRKVAPGSEYWRTRPSSTGREYAEVVAVVFGVALAGSFVPVSYHFFGYIYLLTVIALSLRVGRWPVLFAAVLSAVTWNFVFMPPRLAFEVPDVEDIGAVSGILVVESVFFFEKIGIDDCVGAISVHGVNGAWGCLSLGLFADGTYGDGWNGVAGTVKGLFYGGGMGQFWAELIGVTTCFVTLSILSLVVYYIAEKIVGNRVSLEDEIEGLDVPEMGVPGYAGFVMDKQSETPMPKA